MTISRHNDTMQPNFTKYIEIRVLFNLVYNAL